MKSEEYSIFPLQKKNEFVQHFRQVGVPETILNRLQIITISENRLNIYRHQYNLIKKARYYESLPFSYNDFLLAYLAAEYGYCVISYDKHLQHVIKHYLTFDSYWPEDVIYLLEPTVFLLDTNAIFDINEIEFIFTKTDHEFLIPDFIFYELQEVLRRNTKIQQIENNRTKNDVISEQQATKIECSSDTLKNFVEDQENFESRHMQKQDKVRKKQNKLDLTHRKLKTWKWLVAPRYRSLYQNFIENEGN